MSKVFWKVVVSSSDYDQKTENIGYVPKFHISFPLFHILASKNRNKVKSCAFKLLLYVGLFYHSLHCCAATETNGKCCFVVEPFNYGLILFNFKNVSTQCTAVFS